MYTQEQYDKNYTSGYNQGKVDGKTVHSGTQTITSNTTTDLGADHNIRYITTNVNTASGKRVRSCSLQVRFYDNPHWRIAYVGYTFSYNAKGELTGATPSFSVEASAGDIDRNHTNNTASYSYY